MRRKKLEVGFLGFCFLKPGIVRFVFFIQTRKTKAMRVLFLSIAVLTFFSLLFPSWRWREQGPILYTS